MNRIHTLTLLGALAGAVALNAQNPLSTDPKNSYNGIKNTIYQSRRGDARSGLFVQSQPTERTYGAIVGHIADVQLALCGNAKGEQKKGDAGSKTTKADLTAALKASFDYCDGVYDSMTDADAAAKVTHVRAEQRLPSWPCSISTSHTTTKCTVRWWCTCGSRGWCLRPASAVNPSASAAPDGFPRAFVRGPRSRSSRTIGIVSVTAAGADG